MAASDWLADDEGNLTPEAARAVERLGARAVDQPPPMAAQGWRPSLRAILLTLATITAINVFIAFVPEERERQARGVPSTLSDERSQRPAAATVAPRQEPARTTAARRSPTLTSAPPQGSQRARASEEPLTVHTARPPNGTGTASLPGRSGEIFGTFVRLRARPSLRARIQQTLAPRSTVRVLDQYNGWCKLQLPGGRTGWTFGAYVRGPGHFGLGPAVLTKTLVANTTRLASGTKVLVERRAGPGQVQLLLPDGSRLIAPSNSLRLVDSDGSGYARD